LILLPNPIHWCLLMKKEISKIDQCSKNCSKIFKIKKIVRKSVQINCSENVQNCSKNVQNYWMLKNGSKNVQMFLRVFKNFPKNIQENCWKNLQKLFKQIIWNSKEKYSKKIFKKWGPIFVILQSFICLAHKNLRWLSN
jgi:hypothetical protein